MADSVALTALVSSISTLFGINCSFIAFSCRLEVEVHHADAHACRMLHKLLHYVAIETRIHV